MDSRAVPSTRSFDGEGRTATALRAFVATLATERSSSPNRCLVKILQYQLKPVTRSNCICDAPK